MPTHRPTTPSPWRDRTPTRGQEPRLQQGGQGGRTARRWLDDYELALLTVTVLTGARPGSLASTLSSLRVRAPRLCRGSRVVVLHNGGDASTTTVLERHGNWIDTVAVTETMLPIGAAVTRLWKLALEGACGTILHLEDDWRCVQPEQAWLPAAAELLAGGEPTVAQVRLRLASERVLTYHARRMTRLRWNSRNGHRISPDAHFTFNPSLLPASVARRLVPCTGEPAAMDAFERCREGRKVAQLVPGAFVHTGGDGRSLADRTNGR